jgi:class 3 adenylate cyclase/nitrate reductase NapE component
MAKTSRKLTTIFSADVQGYSRLMEHDEEATLATLKAYRDAMAGLISSHGGRVVNTWGDGVIAEFPSVVEAVRASVDIQTDLAARNAARLSEQRMQFRIGLNLGDVIEDGTDLYGDGVNVAARLQASAEPGGILISQTVYDHVRNKLPVSFSFVGDLQVKNIGEPVSSFSVLVGSQAGSDVRRPPQRLREAAAVVVSPARQGRFLVLMGVAAVVLIVANALTWSGTAWAKWPVLAMATVAGLVWASRMPSAYRRPGRLAVLGVGVAVVNLFTWTGTFWAVWPILAFAVVGALGFFLHRGRQARQG